MADFLIAQRVFGTYADLFVPTIRKGATPKEIASGPKFNLTVLIEHADIKSDWFKTITKAIDDAAIDRFGKPAYEEMLDEGGFDSPLVRSVGSKGWDKDRFKYLIASSSGGAHPPAVKFRNGTLMTQETSKDADGKPEFYFGVELRVSYAVRAYGGLNTGWKAGAKLDLRTVQKVANHPPIKRAGGSDGKELGALPDEPATSLGALAE